jgi:hypothetical protein
MSTKMTGRRVDLVVGSEDDAFVAVHGAIAGLLCQHSPFAKKKLSNSLATRLTVCGAIKEDVVWIYQLMVADENQPRLKQLSEFTVAKLEGLRDVSNTFQYSYLKNKIQEILDARASSSVPTSKASVRIVTTPKTPTSKTNNDWVKNATSFNCGDKGHLARYCPKLTHSIVKRVFIPKKCYKCGVAEHKARECNTANSDEEARRGQVTAALGLKI